MTAIETAIRDAVEKGGWHPYPSHKDCYSLYISEYGAVTAQYIMDHHTPLKTFSLPEITFSPSFWQALGKARGWGYRNEGQGFQQWKNKATQFFVHLMEGGDAESFFTSL